ncbi:hypothetical protein VTJ49DRAFT_240 [Mycothermus thermophilus]|uniref:Spc7 kinetochore protein domain-containing protein n=1 Tax=Humicola insolens TaxID=85995 RepID=A0ABR3VGI8_HUMIN
MGRVHISNPSRTPLNNALYDDHDDACANMAAQEEATLPATRRTRKSIGGTSTTRRSSDKENASLDAGSTAAAAASTRKKSRSKSMGPGGLDTLKTGSANRRASLAAPPRSILKPTMPLLPEIPSYKPKGPAEGTKIALRTEEEQQAAAREREERERARLEKEIRDRRDARRKSLANRRVSFAAEATLHTFHEIDEMPDSTTSSDSTRRTQSSHHQQASSDPPSSPPDHVDEPPQDQPPPRRRRRSSAVSSAFGSDDTMASAYDSDFDHAESVAEEDAIEIEGSSDEDGTIMTVEAEEMTSASSPRSTFDGDTEGSLDENLRLAARRAVTQSLGEDEEVIAGFAGWGRKNHSQENVSQGTTANGNRGASGSYGDHGDDLGSDMDMEADMDMTTAAGKILYPELPSPDKEEDEINEDMSMDVTTALGGILSKATAFLRRKSVNPTSQQPEPTQFGEQTMEFTTAIGGIKKGRVSDVSHFDVDSNEDMSMEFTTAMGGLLAAGFGKSDAQNKQSPVAGGGDDDDGGDLMDMTEAVGRILTDEVEDQDQTVGMDMTVAVGGIIQSASTPAARSAARRVMEEEADEPGHSAAAAMERLGSPERPAASAADGKAAADSSPFRGNGLRRTPPRGLSPTRLSPARSPAQPSSSPMRQSPTPSPKRDAAAQSPARTPPFAAGNRSSSPVRSSPVRNLSPPMKMTPRSPARPSLFHQDPNTGLTTPHVVLTPQVRRLSGVGADRPGLGSPRVAEIFDRRESLGEAASSFVPSVPQNPRRNVAFADPRELEDEIERERREEVDRESGQDGTVNLMEMIQGLSPKKNPLRGRKSLAIGSGRGLLGKRPIELDQDDEDDEENDGVKRLKGHQGSPVKNIRLQSPPSKAETTTGRKTRPSMRAVEPADRATTPTAGSSPLRATTPRDQTQSRFFGGAMDDQPTTTVDFERFSPVRPLGAPHGDAEDGERIHLQDFLNMTSIRFMELTTTKRRHTVAPGTARESIAASKDDLSLERCVVAGACTVPMLEMYQHSCRELKKYISEGRRIVREIETETFEENPPLFREYMTASPEMRVLMDNQFKNVKTHARLLSKAMWYEWRSKLCDGLKEGLLKTAEGLDADEQLLARQEGLLAEVLPGLVARREALERERVELQEAEQELADIDPQDLEDARAELAAVDKALADKSRRLEELRRELEETAEGVDDLAQKRQLCLDEIREADRIREECRGWSVDEIVKHKAQTDAIEKRTGWAIASVSGTTLTMRYRREIELVFDVAAFQKPSSSSSPITIRYIGPTTTTTTPSHRRSSSRDNNIIVGKDTTSRQPTLSPEKAFILGCLQSHLRSRGHSLFPRAAPARRAPMLLRLVADAWDVAGEVEATVRRLNLTFPTVVEIDGSHGDDDDDDAGDQDKENTNGGGDGTAATATVKSSILLAPLQTRVEVRLRLGVVIKEKALLDHGHGNGKDGERQRVVEVAVKPEAGVVYGEPFVAGKMTEFLAGRVAAERNGNGKIAAVVGLGWDEAVVELERRLLAKGRAGQR